MDLTYSLKPVLPADVEQRLNEPPPKAVREFLAEPYPEFVDIFNVTEDLALPRELDWQWMPLAAGDCTFHSGCVYHRADANRTSAMREAMTVAYMSADSHLRLAGVELTGRVHARLRNRRTAPRRSAEQADHPATAGNKSTRKNSCA